MFDKNSFKDSFRSWFYSHPEAEYEDALEYCKSMIPVSELEKYSWLLEQSLAWFLWCRENQTYKNEPEDEDECKEFYLDDQNKRHFIL